MGERRGIRAALPNAGTSLGSDFWVTSDLFSVQVCAVGSLLPAGSSANLTCEALLMLSGNVSLQALAAAWNQSLINATSTWSGEWSIPCFSDLLNRIKSNQMRLRCDGQNLKLGSLRVQEFS
ncbi:unnamed protein product [Tetraodon nigroviridis]|uniref:(spotted green pufferfish) hypothetical protein n=1 Tax=Tetraodon nigroviridis TaxID=99883 RepID=Q4S8K9_TETNG|nr:unnamed protein product [Tetraodon nigroviridis]